MKQARWLLLAGVGSLLACESAKTDRPVVASTEATPVTPRVSWPSPAARDERAFAALGDAARASALLARSPVPVLAPTSVTLDDPTFIVGPEYYSLSGTIEGATIVVEGKRAAYRYEAIAPNPGDRKLRSGTGFVSVNEGIRTTSWVENGVGYALDVECADPGDERCASEAFAIDLVEHLGFAGGGPR